MDASDDLTIQRISKLIDLFPDWSESKLLNVVFANVALYMCMADFLLR